MKFIILLIFLNNSCFARNDNAIQLNIPLTGSLQNPAFSPDNQSIVITRFRNGYNNNNGKGASDLFIFNLNTQVLTTLVNDESSNVNLPGSSWNPVTHEITFSSERGNHDEIFTISENGTPLNGSQTTNRLNKQLFEPSFSPYGQWLVFESHDIDVEQGVVTKYKVDGTQGYIDLTTLAVNAKQPNWSPAGNKILYQQQEISGWALWIMDTDGNNKFKVTDTAIESATDAVFSNDGQWIVYSSENNNTAIASIYRIKIDGSQRLRLTNTSDYDGAVSMTSTMTKIAFESSATEPDISAGTKIWIMTIDAFDLIFKDSF